MNYEPVFNIHEQHAGGDIYNIGRDLNINQNSPVEDILKIIEAIEFKVSELDIAEKGKRKIGNYLDNAKIELEDKNPDKNSIKESIIKTNEILKEAKTTGEILKDIGRLVGKTAIWLGTTSKELGGIF